MDDLFRRLENECKGRDSFGEVLKAIRNRHNLTIERVAQLTGLSKSHFARFEQNARLPVSVIDVIEFCEVLRCNEEEKSLLLGAYYCSVLKDRNFISGRQKY